MKTYTWLSILTIPTATFLVWLLTIPNVIAVYAPPEIPKIPEELQRIANCESGGRQWQKNSKGVFEVVRGRANPRDIGWAQINEKYWLEKSKELGYDIYTLEGNQGMALWIYRNYGSRPWFWSSPCWDKRT